MKKRLALLLAVMMFCLVGLTACGGGAGEKADERIVGKWTVTKLASGGMEINPETMGMTVTFDFKDNGKVELDLGEKSGPETAKWSSEGDTVTIKDSKDETSATYADGTLTFENFPNMDGIVMTLEKE